MMVFYGCIMEGSCQLLDKVGIVQWKDLMGWWGKEHERQPFTRSFGIRSHHLGNGKHEEIMTISRNVCNKLFSIGKKWFGNQKNDMPLQLIWMIFSYWRRFSISQSSYMYPERRFQRHTVYHAVLVNNLLLSVHTQLLVWFAKS